MKGFGGQWRSGAARISRDIQRVGRGWSMVFLGFSLISGWGVSTFFAAENLSWLLGSAAAVLILLFLHVFVIPAGRRRSWTEHGGMADEVEQLGGAFQVMLVTMAGSFEQLQRMNQALTAGEVALRESNESLEAKVQQRTQELDAMNEELLAINEELMNANLIMESEVTDRKRAEQRLETVNQELSTTLTDLKRTQTELIQSEKLSALGSLVAGVAHEINTPLGTSVTAASHIEEMTRIFAKRYREKQAKAQDLNDYLAEHQEALSILLANLDRAAQLVKSFKNVASTQVSEAPMLVDLGEYLQDVLLTLRPRLKKTRHTIAIHCPEKIEWDGYPGAFAQVITNLVMNSLNHAYGPEDAGQISIAVRRQADQILLTYSDNGEGMSTEVRKKIFDPFFTTKRGRGGTGLGLYNIYNIVTQQFAGTIDCESQPGRGAVFTLQFPVRRQQLTEDEKRLSAQ